MFCETVTFLGLPLGLLGGIADRSLIFGFLPLFLGSGFATGTDSSSFSNVSITLLRV